jgi:hypothetical protein
MTENQQKPKTGGKTFKLLLVIVLVLAVPIVMDQVEVDPDNVRMAGRIAVGVTGLLFVIGLFKKLLKVMAFVVLGLIALVFLVAEGHIKAPRVSQWFASKSPK